MNDIAEAPVEGEVIERRDDVDIDFDTGLPAFESFDEWTQFGHMLGDRVQRVRRQGAALMFALGDWWLSGEGTYGEDAYQAVRDTGYHIKTIRNAAWVAKNIPPDERRDTLEFGHHESVAKLEYLERERWLTEAEEEDLTVAELRKRVRDAKAELEQPRIEAEQQEAKASVAAMRQEQGHDDDDFHSDGPFPMLGDLQLDMLGDSYVLTERQGAKEVALATIYPSERSTADGTPLDYAIANFMMEVLSGADTEVQAGLD